MCVCIMYVSSYLSFDALLGCFYISAIVNNAAVNIGYMYLFKLVFVLFLDIYPGVELLGHMGVLLYF